MPNSTLHFLIRGRLELFLFYLFYQLKMFLALTTHISILINLNMQGKNFRKMFQRYILLTLMTIIWQ
uniref:Uncharacterized protein n=1 Tax=Meloidogyne enterolobii TaxID=390850 RepID=A0A6V7UHK6_MELEN|nr:unnamed protein product [Meloidogyne enterolobii]